jgi:hypothetical protein
MPVNSRGQRVATNQKSQALNKQKAQASALRKPVNQDGKRKASGSTSSAGSSIGGGTAASSS